MKRNLRERILAFIKSYTERPVLAGFSVGIYMLLFYHSNNFDLANSLEQLLFSCTYFIVLPCLALYVAYKKASWFNFECRQLLFIGMMSFLALFILQNLSLSYSYKRIFVACFIAIVLLSFKFRNYKIIVVLLLFMSIFPAFKIGQILYANFSNTDWTKQPDAIMATKFTKKPNVYYIQVDGYANASTLPEPPYNYDNSEFNAWLSESGFTQYPDFRCNYNSTLKSNASCFGMLHHFSDENVGFLNATDYIIDRNPVVKIFDRNDYKTFFITEKPYLLMNRPNINFDYSNFTLSELPFLKDGWSITKEITSDIKRQIIQNKQNPNFFFIEKFDPGHIAVHKNYSKGKEGEKAEYLKRLKIANAWLKDIVGFIAEKDPNAIVIIGADHGGFVGFDYSLQSFGKIEDKQLLNSIFGAALAIKWNDPAHSQYDSKLRSSVNLFRTLFAYLSDDLNLLNNLQPDTSYNNLSTSDPTKIYIAIE